MKKITLATLAEKTGVSISTVSRVLSGNSKKCRISKETQAAILREAGKYNYSPPGGAQNFRCVKSRTIGLLLPSVANPYFAEMAGVIISELDKSHYTTIVADTMENGHRLSEMARSLYSRQVDGIIVVPCGNDASTLEYLGTRLPLVLIDRYFEGTGMSYVTTNNYQGGLEATKHLISKGYRKITCAQGVQDSMPNRERVRGYKDAMAEAGLGANINVVGNEFSVQCGYLETKLLLDRDERPDAIFALSNTIVLGATKAIREAGLSVPDDIALLTFDNNLFMDFMTPSMTRISQPVDDMARLSVKILLDKLSGNSSYNSQLLLTPTLIAGGSA